MSDRIEPRVLKGFRDFLPEVETRKKNLMYTLERAFELYGFTPIDTPILEFTEVLLGKGGGETDKQVYRFLDQGNRDVVMRFDLTVPFARYIALHKNELYLPFKRYHIAKVWRGENTQRGRYREFTQCDFDIVGTDGASADFEILLLMRKSFKALGIQNISIRLSHRGIFNALLSRTGLEKKATDILRTVDKLSKIGESKVRIILSEMAGDKNADLILDFIRREGDFTCTLEKMDSLAGGVPEEKKRLRLLHQYMEETGSSSVFTLDPSITRGLDYYTGVVFETFLDDMPEIGSVCSGGRYNNLASLYTSDKIPGVGASIGLDRLMAAMEASADGQENGSVSQVLIFCLDEELYGYYHSLAETVREHRINVEVFPEKKKLSQQFIFAEKKNIPLGIICGKDERSRNVFSVKDLRKRKSYDDQNSESGIQLIHNLLERHS